MVDGGCLRCGVGGVWVGVVGVVWLRWWRYVVGFVLLRFGGVVW